MRCLKVDGAPEPTDEERAQAKKTAEGLMSDFYEGNLGVSYDSMYTSGSDL